MCHFDKSENTPPVTLTETTHHTAVAFARACLNFHADPKQAEVLEATTKRGLLNCSRQWGKSTVTAAKAVHRAFTVPESLVLVLSPTERQSAEFIRKAKTFIRRLKIRARGDGDNSASILLPNKSRIVGLPGTEATVRGFSAVSLMLIDEAARVKDEMYEAVRPMLAVGGGELWLMSTPWGSRGFFYETWTRGGPEWLRITVPATDCPRIPKSFLDEERRTLGDRVFRREYLCEFSDNEYQLFSEDILQRALRDDIEPLYL